MAGKDFIDFAQLKEQVSIAQCVQMLDLRMKGNDQLRSACPQCRAGGERSLAVNVSKSSYYCFSEGKGGDQIALVAHIRGVSQREAALEMAEHFRVATPKQEETPKPQPTTAGGMKPLDYLEHSHDAVQVLGFDAEIAEALGIGYASKGLMRGTIAVPIRLEDGTLVGYIGLTEIEKMPSKWQLPVSNVVTIPKRTA
ncbi:MAG TPA: CHC2 zinc finger domain-containing protein [Candidatus Acidoferrum sp.]|jgi:DNA primase|nr:CHC2 zinc finger domain-containing protein [Candidatus Acidoferrum sp.]